jgi:hypothetical protein
MNEAEQMTAMRARSMTNSEVHRWNLNKACRDMVCPECRAIGTAYHDPETSDHPGVFECKACNGATFYA